MWTIPKEPGVYLVVPRSNPFNLNLWQARLVTTVEDVSGETLKRCMFFGPIPLEDPPQMIDTAKYYQ